MNGLMEKFFLFVAGIVLAGLFSTGIHAQEKTAVSGKIRKNDAVRFLASPFPKPLPPSTRVRIAVLDISGTLIRANNIALLLTRFRRRELEEKIGMKIERANWSRDRKRPKRGNVVYYRSGFLRAAMLVAKAVPGEQTVMPMPKAFAAKTGVDVEIHLDAEPR
ncbi:MAG: hypothetical protein V3S64_13740 [bacterium]